MGLVNVSVVGNVIKDPVRKDVNNRPVATITVAVDRWKSDQGEGSSDFYNVEVWGRLAEIATKYIQKGNQIAAVGRLALDKWQDREGQTRTTMVVHADQISLPQKPRSQENTNTPNDSWRNNRPSTDSGYDYAAVVQPPPEAPASSPEPEPHPSENTTHPNATLLEQSRGDTSQTDEFQISEDEEATPAPTHDDAAALFGGAPTSVPA